MIIENVEKDHVFCNHPTPAMYGFKSYISVPIFRKDGSFFGTLCSIDPRPAKVDTQEILDMFNLFADLIAFHLMTLENLKKTTQKLQEERTTGELREQFIAILGHDLRNPVSTTRMAAELLLQQTTEENTRHLAQLLKSTSFRMQNLIENILDFARGHLGEGISLDLSPSKETLKNALQQVLDEVRLTAPENTINTTVSIDKPVACDPQRIAQLFSNLLGNAVTHGSKDYPIEVKAISKDGEFELVVRNEGEKIPEAAMERLFKPFSRHDINGGKKGLGLGLFIASEIAQAHKGSLTADSSENGTEFIFRMPLNRPSLN